MNNANPALMSSQPGHSLEEFFKKYAKWINRVDNQTHMEFIEVGLNGTKKKTGIKTN
ncbi:MAG: hypothetical protein KZQ83_06340 [gamma proteobacterium symbiont of Taylorina sp.]|nr:hypothetical protein [gamma proteobacterium symbiont of Taylorina sp.]